MSHHECKCNKYGSFRHCECGRDWPCFVLVEREARA